MNEETRKIHKANFCARKTAKQFLGPMSQRLIRAQSATKSLIRVKKQFREKIRKIGPNECGILYNDKRGILLGVCNKNGRLRFIKKALEEI